MAQFAPSNDSEFAKLRHDVNDVLDKIRIYAELVYLEPTASIDDALAEILGFLEACKERFAELIEAGSHGLLDESLFALVLKTNDYIIKIFEAELVQFSIFVILIKRSEIFLLL